MPLVGCTLATQQDILKLDDDITHLRKNQADLVAKMADLSSNLETLNSQLDSSQQRMSTLSQKLDDIQADIARRMSVLSGQVTGTTGGQAPSTPGDAFRLAYNDYQAGKFDLAVVGFRNFVDQFPKAELAASAQFYIGECEFARKNWLAAAKEYEKVSQNYPKTDFTPRALFKRGMALQQADRTADARDCFKKLLHDYPRHELAKSARDILKESE
ncbi:MAG TPA: tol-pal system protein YbgF [Elusimicrobiota bacterium]|nr:tol-pal system protein YbgF [Elusimicrobiota bacterium]